MLLICEFRGILPKYYLNKKGECAQKIISCQRQIDFYNQMKKMLVIHSFIVQAIGTHNEIQYQGLKTSG